jgi:hypothetical protein
MGETWPRSVLFARSTHMSMLVVQFKPAIFEQWEFSYTLAAVDIVLQYDRPPRINQGYE